MNLSTSLLSLLLIAGVAILGTSRVADAQPADANYDESKVPNYTLPDPLQALDGTPIKTPGDWERIRRPEILRLFESEVYGKTPTQQLPMRAQVISDDPEALGGQAIRQQIKLTFSDDPNGPSINLLLYLPNNIKEPVPTFVGLNFKGNHTVHPDPAILLPEGAAESDRGTRHSRWPVEEILKQGYGLATAWYYDIDPDLREVNFSDGVHPLFYNKGQDHPVEDEWGSIGAWAWGLSRILDYLIDLPMVRSDGVILMGHSRLGKTSLWAGAQDERFAIVISNDSGCGGAALSRREFGETVARINSSFPHWFCDRFPRYNDDLASLPVDQHLLIALIAPRPVLVCSAEDDQWADPKGEFLSAYHAGPVYRLLGTDGFASTDQMPGLNEPILSTIGYHIRPGPHDVTLRDWKVYMEFADRHLD